MSDDKKVLVNSLETEHGNSSSDAPQTSNPPPSYTSAPTFNPPPAGNAASNYTEELPPPYTPNQTVHCRVCRNVLTVPPGPTVNIIRCPACQESTAIRPAPPGKKYIRCPCNCLLVCNASSTRVVCPRTNCGRTLVTGVPVAGGGIRRRCAHCDIVMRVRSPALTLVRCSACGRTSWVDSDAKTRRVAVYLGLAAFLLIAGIIVTAVTISLAAHGGFYVIWIGAFIAGVLNLIRGSYLACLPASRPVEPGA